MRLGEFWEVVGSVFSRRWGRYYMDSLEFTSSSSSNDWGSRGMLGGAHTAEGTSLREEFDEGPNAFLGSQDGLKGYCRGGV